MNIFQMQAQLQLELAQAKLAELTKEQVTHDVSVVPMEHVNDGFNALGALPREKLRGLIVLATYDEADSDGKPGCGVQLVSMGTPAILEALLELQVAKVNSELAEKHGDGPCPGCGQDHSQDVPGGGGLEALMNALLGAPKRGDRH